MRELHPFPEGLLAKVDAQGHDAEVVLHEYTHGLSNRRVGGGAGLSALQSGGLGEGWSDFYALSLLSESSDDPNACYASGGYASMGVTLSAPRYSSMNPGSLATTYWVS